MRKRLATNASLFSLTEPRVGSLEINLRPNPNQQRRVDSLAKWIHNLDIGCDVAPGRHSDIVVELDAMLIAQGQQLGSEVLKRAAGSHVEVANSEGVVLAVGNRTGSADPGAGHPANRARIVVGNSQVPEHSPALAGVRVGDPEGLIKIVSERP